MNFCGIICEFNPFHNGHAYIIREAKRRSKLPVICIMSGNYTQRGELAIQEKHIRATNAIKAGADIVIELPTVFAISSAENYANAGIKILNSLNCVEYLCFGSECGEIEDLKAISNVINSNSTVFKTALTHELEKGKSYASAIMQATKEVLPQNKVYLSKLLDNANDKLAIEYLKALTQINSKIKPIAIKRIGADYKENKPIDKYCSASYIRDQIEQGNISDLREYLPDYSYNSLINLQNSFFEKKLKLYILRTTNIETLKTINEVTEGLEYRFKKNENVEDINELIENVKTKRYTHNKLRRAMLNNTLNITKDKFENYKTQKLYANVLAISDKSMLSLLKKSNIPIIYSARDAKKLNSKDLEIYNIDKQTEIISNLSN